MTSVSRNTLVKLFAFMFAICTAFAIATMSITRAEEEPTFEVVQGASIRDDEDGVVGLKFESKFNNAWLLENTADSYTFGTIVYPASNDILFDKSLQLAENIDALDAVNVVYASDIAISEGKTFSASIVYDKEVVKSVIEQNSLEVTDELVNELLHKLYNKDLTARSYAVIGEDVIYTNSYTTSMYKVATRTYEKGVVEENNRYKELALNYLGTVTQKQADILSSNGVLALQGGEYLISDDTFVVIGNKTLKEGVDYTINGGVISFVDVQSKVGTSENIFIINNGSVDMITANYVNVSIMGIEVEPIDQNTAYLRTDDVSKYLQFRFVYSDESKSDYYPLNEGNIASISVAESLATVSVKVVVQNQSYIDTVTLTVTEEVISVSDILSSTVDSNYALSGVVVSFATTISQNEVILMDKTDGSVISVVGLGGGNVYNVSFNLNGISVGDEIILPVQLKQAVVSNADGNSGKVYAQFIGGSNTEISVISEDNAVELSTATVIDSQEDLISFLSSANRAGNVYKTVKFRGEMNFVMDNKYESYDLWFYNLQASKVDDIKIDGLIPTVSNPATYYATGKTFGEIAFDNSHASNIDYANPLNIIKEINALYIGGNDTHAQFVILTENAVVDATPTIVTKDFVAPNQLIYVVGDELNFEGSTITYNYDIRSSVTIDVTADMVKNMPVIDSPGNYAITVNDGATDFEFIIEVISSRIKSIEVSTMPTKSEYNHRDTFDTLDMSGGKILVTYENTTTEYVDITKEMFNLEESDEWKIGTVNYTLYYAGTKFVLPIVYKNTALSISEFKSATVGETYDVTGVLVGPMNSWAYGELLIKDKNSDEMISVVHTATFGSYSNLNLDTTVHNIGDEIIFSAKLYQIATDSTYKGSRGRYQADAIDKDTFVKSLMIVSTGNSVKFNLTEATTISSYSELSSFITSWSNTYKFVKFSGLKGKYGATGYSIFFGDTYSYVSGSVPFIDMRTSKKYVANAQSSTYFDNYKGATQEDCAVAKGDIYALYIGGNKTYLNFVILDADWFVEPSVTE